MSDENKVVEQQKNNKKRNLIIAVAVGVVVFSGLMVYFLNQDKSALKVKENIVYELGDVVSLKSEAYLQDDVADKVKKETKLTSKLMSDKEKYTFDKKKVTVVTKDKEFLGVGKYEVNLKYKDETKDVPFEVKDTKAPVFKDFKTEIRIEKDAENVNLKDYFEANDLSDVEIKIDEKDFDVTKEGKCDIVVTAVDQYKNATEKKSVVVVVSSEDAEKNGLTATKDGEIPVSKKTKEKVDKGEVTVKKSEDKIEKPKEDNKGSSNTSTSKPNEGTTSKPSNPEEKPSKPNNGGSETKPSHTHKWVEQYKTMHHPEQGHYENILIQEAWDEVIPQYTNEARSICNGCGADITGNTTAHMKEGALNGTSCRGYHTEYVPVFSHNEIIHHDAVYENKYVVDQAAWDEQVLSGYKCSCGATK